MRALILAGGLGTRLRPLTYTRPKHLLPVANVPHIEHVLELLGTHGITDVVLLISYLADRFDAVVERASGRGLTMNVTHEEEPLGTAGALKHAESFVRDDTFVVFNGDILTTVDLGAVLAFHRDRDAEATIVLTPVEDPSAFGVVPTRDDGRVLGFIEKPPAGEAPTNLINAGVYVLEPSVLDRIPAGEVWSAERALFPQLVEEGSRMFAVPTSSYWMDVGTPEKYLQANLDALSGAFTAPSVPAVQDGVVNGSDVRVAAGARVTSSVVGDGCVLADGAVVEGSVLLPSVAVGEGAEVRDSVLGEGARVADGARVTRQTAADGSRVG